MIFTDFEIACHIRQAKNPIEQLEIEAQLNGCSRARIRRIAIEHNVMPNILPDTDKNLRVLYEQGLTDTAIAERVGQTATHIRQWRRRNGLPAAYKSKVYKKHTRKKETVGSPSRR